MVDYTKGRYNVFQGRGPTNILVGRIDEDEFVRNDSGKLLYRIDGDEFYEVDGAYIGRIEQSDGDRAMVVDRRHTALFTIVPE
jgi:hypothetical protein